MACSLNYLSCYGSYSVEERKILGIDLEHESDFLQDLSLKICELNQWVETSWDTTSMMMSFDVKAHQCGCFNQHLIQGIINIIEEACEKSFLKLREFGWCSGYDIEGSIKNKIEFSWLNQSKNRTQKNKEKLIKTELCSCLACNFRYSE